NGEYIISVKANYDSNDIPERLKSLLHKYKSQISCTKVDKELKFRIKGKGSEKLTLTNPHDIVIRTSSFVCPRTLATNCDAAANTIPRQMVKLLRDQDAKGIFVIEIT